tara:strand:+ start:3495 stop:4727 length:1233 start_codon:yes stop_codon:yes gene_type:complete
MKWREPNRNEISQMEHPKGFDDYEFHLGDILRGERATMGKSLLDVEKELKIKANYIVAIENCDPTVFESQGFIAGSVRSYARYLELDPDMIYELFCNESGFHTMHGMAKSDEQKEEKKHRKKTEDSLFISPTTAYLPEQKKWYENIEPGAVGSLCVTIALVSALGYGAWSFFQEIQKVDLTPTESQPVVLTELQNLPTALDITNNLMLDKSVGSKESSSRINRIYRSTALDQPVIVARDEPISKLDPNQFGLFTPIPESNETGIEEIISALIPKKNSDKEELQLNFPKVSADTPPLVTLITSKEAWIEIIAADGSVIFKNLMQPGSEFALPQTEKSPKLLAGMSGYVYMAIDGVLYGPAGKGVNVVKNVALDATSIMASYEPAQINADPDLKKLVAELKFNSFNIKSVDQ